MMSLTLVGKPRDLSGFKHTVLPLGEDKDYLRLQLDKPAHNPINLNEIDTKEFRYNVTETHLNISFYDAGIPLKNVSVPLKRIKVRHVIQGIIKAGYKEMEVTSDEQLEEDLARKG